VGSWDPNFFSTLDTLLNFAEQYGMYLFIDNHQFSISPQFGGMGLPAWMFTGISNMADAWTALYNNVTIQGMTLTMHDAIGEFWQKVCAITKDRNIVMGYDIFNEPGGAAILNRRGIGATHFLEDISAYIRDVDSVKPVAVGNAFIDYNTRPVIPGGNFFCSPHGYALNTYGKNLANMETFFLTSGYWIEGPNWNVPTFNAEWNLLTQDEDAGLGGLTDDQLVQWYNLYIQALEQVHPTGWVYLQREATIEDLHWNPAVKPTLQHYFNYNESIFRDGDGGIPWFILLAVAAAALAIS
jgi:hypothetical protein